MSSWPEPGVLFSSGTLTTAGGKRRALFLDRDGVINVNHGYVHTADQTEWVPGIFEMCRAAAGAGLHLVVVTNQAGIARGYYSQEQFLEYTRWMHEQFESRSVPLAATYYCPHHPVFGIDDLRIECGCRKPKPGMILAAADDLGLDLEHSVLVGDMATDLEAAEAAGVGAAFFVADAYADIARVIDSAGH